MAASAGSSVWKEGPLAQIMLGTGWNLILLSQLENIHILSVWAGGLAAIYTQTGNSMVQNLKEPSRYVGVRILVSSPEPVCKSESGVLQQRRNEFSGSTSQYQIFVGLATIIFEIKTRTKITKTTNLI